MLLLGLFSYHKLYQTNGLWYFEHTQRRRIQLEEVFLKKVKDSQDLKEACVKGRKEEDEQEESEDSPQEKELPKIFLLSCYLNNLHFSIISEKMPK